MVLVIGILALVFNFTGVLLLVRQGVPHGLLADMVALEHNPRDRELCGNDRRRLWSFIGMVMFALGSTLQMASIVLASR